MAFGDGVFEWCLQRLPPNPSFEKPFSIGFLSDNDVLMGAIIFDNWRPVVKNIYISVVIEDRRMITAKMIRYIADYAFNQLQCNRVTATIDSENKRSINLTKKLGFKLEGNLRQASTKLNDLLIFGMLRSECKWFQSSGIE